MKKIIFLFTGSLLLMAFAAVKRQVEVLEGAFKKTSNGQTELVLIKDNYLVFTGYNGKTFQYTRGGALSGTKENLSLKVEFDTRNKGNVGKDEKIDFSLENNMLRLNGETLERVDDGKGTLAGNWRISGRKQGDKMASIQPGARKTLKMLTGSRFQWTAINTETGEFFGSGGGTYTFRDGKYSEQIEYFSRDSTRVGATLSFDGKVIGNDWTHSGLSSKGDPIHEIWSRENPVN